MEGGEEGEENAIHREEEGPQAYEICKILGQKKIVSKDKDAIHESVDRGT